MSIKVIFFGTPLFAAKHLEQLVAHGIEVVAVVTKPDRPQGRSLVPQPPPVKVYAQKLIGNIPLFQPEKCSTPEFVEILKAIPADLYAVVAYGEIIKQTVLDLPKFGCVNVHASRLPYYRGAAPIQRCLMNGETETGISVIQLVLKMDAGDILKLEKVPIDLNMTCPELEDKLCEVGSKCLLEVIANFTNDTVSRVAQDHALATFAAKVTVEECQIDWKKPAIAIHNLVRAVTPHPGAWCMVSVRGQQKRLKILRSEYDPEINQESATVFQKSKDSLAVACGQGAIWLKEVQLEGKQPMHTSELLKGISADQISFKSHS